ncbi:hypothetical protein RHSIM_Rhsim01G0205700 [Rhododendron simsii]|uniref:Uncharacterized protein n=1 Tax=Rhododendron simsii TaxID=118357 RepID=A0A834HHF9_RHOSS|nr:hypothetical protein RHSIM_Rhsim01G0205700 [Rhododendron simsii]
MVNFILMVDCVYALVRRVVNALTPWKSVLRKGDDHYGKRRVGDALTPWTSVLRRGDDDDGKMRVGDALTPYTNVLQKEDDGNGKRSVGDALTHWTNVLQRGNDHHSKRREDWRCSYLLDKCFTEGRRWPGCLKNGQVSDQKLS